MAVGTRLADSGGNNPEIFTTLCARPILSKPNGPPPRLYQIFSLEADCSFEHSDYIRDFLETFDASQLK